MMPMPSSAIPFRIMSNDSLKKNFVVPQVSQKLLQVQGTTTTASTTDSSGAQNLDSLETHATVVGGDVPQAQLETSSNMDSTD